MPSFVSPTNGNVMLVKLLQLENAELPILVTLSGTTMLVNDEQPENAE